MVFSIRTDRNGIPHSEYGYYKGKAIGTQVSPLYVAENGLRSWNSFLRQPGELAVILSGRWCRFLANPDNDPSDQYRAEGVMNACADWLVEHIVEKGKFSVWEYPYPMSYSTPAGWCSGHAQVVGLQLLVRAGRAEHVDTLLETLAVSVKQGGIAEHIAPGAVWFEKFSHPENEQPKVLNGHLFAVIGLYDIAERLGLYKAKILADQGMEAARLLMPNFDLGGWSGYNIHGKPASKHYHNIVVRQLEILGDEADWAKRWHLRFKGYLCSGS